MKGTRCVDAGKKSNMSKIQKQCWNCKKNDKGFCLYFETWCYMVNREECKNKVIREKSSEKKEED